MSFELFVALRYLCARRKQAFITVISAMSVAGVALGVAALVIVLGVYNGFSTDIRNKLLAANAHIILTRVPVAEDPVKTSHDIIQDVEGIQGAAPFIYTEGMISTPRGVKGVVLRGVDPQTAPKAIEILRNLKEGSLETLDGGALHGVIIGHELASRLGVRTGSRVNLLSPSGQASSTGYQPRIKPFRVSGIFQSGLFEYDTSVGFLSLQGARELTGASKNFLSGIEVSVVNPDKADKIASALQEKLGPLVKVRHWMEMNANLFAALRLEKLGMFIVLALIVLIGSFSIVTTLVMLVMEKTRDIAVLMSMGASKKMIRNIFILQGVIIGLVGTLCGYVLGIGLGLALQKYHFIKLPEGVYTVDHLPVLLQFEDIALVGLCAMLLCFLATLYPARKAASLEPSDALRYE